MRAILPIVVSGDAVVASDARPSLTGVACSILLCAAAAFVLTAFGEGLGTIPLPTFLDASMSMVPASFRAHILACCLGLVAAGATMKAALAGHPHRRTGRLAFTLLLIGGVASIPVAIVGPSSPTAKVAFMGQAATLILAISVGWLAGFRGQHKLHRNSMICAGLALCGAPLSRLALKVPDPWLSPAAGYAFVAWFSWLGPFVLVATFRVAGRFGTSADKSISL